MSLVIEPDTTVAVVGATGSGKTSLVNLIPRFYDVTEGAVLVDGHDVRDVTLTSLRGQVGFVMQDSLLFSGTVAENIAYGRPDATEDSIEAAARAAQADEFVRELPDGYATRVGERGVKLSGGQRQRIAIARALLIDPRILVMDDSTSSVDSATEAPSALSSTRSCAGARPSSSPSACRPPSAPTSCSSWTADASSNRAPTTSCSSAAACTPRSPQASSSPPTTGRR